MTNTISKRDKSVKDNLSKWDNAIADAKKGISRLQLAIEVLEERKAAGEPWPGTVTPLHENAATHN